jgi:hypothetical protein
VCAQCRGTRDPSWAAGAGALLGAPQRAHSASLLPRLSGLRLRFLRPRFAQVPSALIVSDRGKGAVLQVQCPGRLTSVLGQQHQKRPSTRRLSGYGLVYRECRLCRRTFPPALGASRTLAASCALGADLPLCRLILCGRILRVRNLLMILNFAPNQCRSHGSDHAPSQSAWTAVDVQSDGLLKTRCRTVSRTTLLMTLGHLSVNLRFQLEHERLGSPQCIRRTILGHGDHSPRILARDRPVNLDGRSPRLLPGRFTYQSISSQVDAAFASSFPLCWSSGVATDTQSASLASPSKTSLPTPLRMAFRSSR